VRCLLCAHRCVISEGHRGVCGVRENRGGAWSQAAAHESRMMHSLLLFAAVAYLAAWWREIEGGTALATIAVALGGVAFTAAQEQPFAASLVVSLPLLLAGGLFYLSGRYSLRTTLTRF
jgi:hypothetical protein